MDEHDLTSEELPCKDKLAFDTRREAEATANVVQYRYGSRVHAYACRCCGLWHLSSGPTVGD